MSRAIESAASGILAGINAAKLALGEAPVAFPKTTMVGSMANYITTADAENFQPMNANFGIVPSLDHRIRDKRERNTAVAHRALTALDELLPTIGVTPVKDDIEQPATEA